jgi:hypothetical protein
VVKTGVTTASEAAFICPSAETGIALVNEVHAAKTIVTCRLFIIGLFVLFILKSKFILRILSAKQNKP